MYDHDLRLVVLAVTICGFASFTAVNLLGRVLASAGLFRLLWLSAAAFTLGSGIWSTHFVAMLAYTPGLPVGYDVQLTLASIVIAVLITGLGLATFSLSESRRLALLAGAIVGLGIGAMHFTGMAALRLPGRISYDPTLLAASWLLGMAISAAAFALLRNCRPLGFRLRGAVVLTLAIGILHFTGMGAVTVVADPGVSLQGAVFSPDWLAIAIAGATFSVLLIALVGGIFDQHLGQRSVEEAERLRDLANASVEGIVVCRDRRIVDANQSFLSLVDAELASLIGRNVADFLGAETTAQLFDLMGDDPDSSCEAALRAGDGEAIPVELRLRMMKQRGGLSQVLSVRDVRERNRAEERIQYLAHHDALTGLANRTLFHARLEHDLARASRTGEKLAVICLDMDRFKEVNDVFGHPAGDSLLRQVGQRLQATIRTSDTVARLGGDEFAIVQVGVDQPESASVLAHRLVSQLAKAYEHEGGELVSGTSIGIAIYPDDGADVDTLLRNADLALYRAKDEGRGCYCFFEADMDERLRKQRMLEIDLRQAIDRNEFEVVYQPQANADTADVVGFEALLRWEHRTEGSIPPSVFIPLAEQCGFIHRLGIWVLNEACREAATWEKPLRIAVNLSPVQFQQSKLADEVERVLAVSGLAPHRLELEITEGVLMKDKNRALSVLRHLKSLGVRIAMDDFGTGYSSLSTLQAFPFDKLKIDRSFVMRLSESSEAQAIIRAILALGRGLELPVVAEGVESGDQLGMLKNEHCDEIQGFLIGKPLPMENYRDLVSGALSEIPVEVADGKAQDAA